jgi:hypothetical protein
MFPIESTAMRGDREFNPGEWETLSFPLSQPVAARNKKKKLAALRTTLDLRIIMLSIVGVPPDPGV